MIRWRTCKTGGGYRGVRTLKQQQNLLALTVNRHHNNRVQSGQQLFQPTDFESWRCLDADPLRMTKQQIMRGNNIRTGRLQRYGATPLLTAGRINKNPVKKVIRVRRKQADAFAVPYLNIGNSAPFRLCSTNCA